ncbi:MAG: hypothetical protein NVSMB24_31710 [Mucilaginibacter sp.]
MKLSYLLLSLFVLAFIPGVNAQKKEWVKIIKQKGNEVAVFIGDKPFTTFLYPDTLEKPVLYPLRAANGAIVTRGFPLDPRPGDPTDHPHHIGMWLTYENVNGLDFWNNSYAIPKEKKQSYGWIRTDHILSTSDGQTGKLGYHANWTNHQKEVLLEETTSFEFSGNAHQRIIDRTTVLTARQDVTFTDAKDGLFGLRLSHELEIPAVQNQKFTDNKGIVTTIKSNADNIAGGTYLTSAGKRGNDAWSTRAVWCKAYGKIRKDSISVTIIDHPRNPNYPTFWHARGYGLFAANPLGEKVFTNGKSEKNLRLKKGESVTFRYRVVVNDGAKTVSAKYLDEMAGDFGK